MSGVILCTKQSDTPYKLKDTDINIYSIEELAYYLYNNAYFVDEDFFNEDLINYIDEKLGLGKISNRLKYAMGQKMNFVEYIMIILTGSGYYAENEIKLFEKEIKLISAKSMPERMKARADMLFNNKKLSAAKQVYENIIKGNPANIESKEFYADVHYGLAKIYCRMFYFNEAIDEFKKAYELNNEREILRALIYSKIMKEKNTGVLQDFSKENEKDAALLEECKSEIENLEKNIINGDEYTKLSKIFIYDGKRNLDDYYEDIQNVLDDWKEEYRNDIN